MPTVNPTCFHLSASSISSFKACPTRFRLAYREGLRLAEDTDSQRMGTNWHRMHEIYAAEMSHAKTVCAEIRAKFPNANQDASGDVEAGNANGLQAVINHLNEVYKKAPAYKTITEWELEREILLVSFVGYLWRWQEDPIEVLASEVPFDLPIHNHLGLPLPISEVKRVGKIDHVIRWQGAICALERKSTSRAIDPDSDYWDKSKKDTQVSMYALAFRDMAEHDSLPDSVNEILYGDNEQRTEGQALSDAPAGSVDPEQSVCGSPNSASKTTDSVCHTKGLLTVSRETETVSTVSSSQSGNQAVSNRHEQGAAKFTEDLAGNSKVRHSVCQLPLVPARSDVRFGGCLYDVWHKPTISPKMLTQADTKVFIETGDYMGQKFSVQERFPNPDPAQVSINVDGTWAEIEMGKKGFAIRETVKMFGARLLSDIYERPDFYYARREIVRTDAELQKFRGELYAIYQTQKAMDKTGNWYENESQCRATFPCPYIAVCYSTGADAVCDGSTTPAGYKRIFVDLTVNNQAIEE